MQEFKNIDGTYTSPRNGKVYKSEKAFRSHWFYKPSESQNNWQEINKKKTNCSFCNKETGITTISKHEKSCYLNPKNITHCLNCNNPIKDYKHSKGTCSRSCANKHFRTGEDNGNYKGVGYAIICYRHHEKKCIVCGESDAVDVHHLDRNRENNSPENLIPLCPTHHAYCHRNLYFKIEETINSYLENFRM